MVGVRRSWELPVTHALANPLLPGDPGDEMPDFSLWETDVARDKGHLRVQVCGKLPRLSLCLPSSLRHAFPIPLQVLVHPADSFPSSSPTASPTLSCSPVHFCHRTADCGGWFLLVWFWWKVLSCVRGPLWLQADVQLPSVCQEDAQGIGKITKYSLLSAMTKCRMQI